MAPVALPANPMRGRQAGRGGRVRPGAAAGAEGVRALRRVSGPGPGLAAFWLVGW